jgi:hypothetical protein
MAEKCEELSLEELEKLKKALQERMDKNAEVNRRIRLKTGKLDEELLRENDELARKIQDIASAIYKKKKVKICFTG